jgi:hypothetical protein
MGQSQSVEPSQGQHAVEELPAVAPPATAVAATRRATSGLAFSAHSYGFRPGRRAQDAVLAAQAHVQSGLRVVVDVDWEKFFDRVNHDLLMDRLSRRIEDAGVIRLIRAYLNSGIMSDGVVQASPNNLAVAPFPHPAHR